MAGYTSLDLTVGYVVKYANVNTSSSGATAIVSPVAGRSIVPLQYTLVSTSSNALSWQSSGGTVHCGPLPFAANGGISSAFNQAGHFKTVAGEGLSINLGSAAQVGGSVVYVEF